MGNAMRRFLLGTFLGMALAGFVLASLPAGQAMPSENVASAPAENPGPNEAAAPRSNDAAPTPSNNSIQPLQGSTGTSLHPASLLPDPPSIRPAKVSLIGSTID